LAEGGTIRLRLLRDPAPPTPDGSALRFGLQDSKGGIVPGVETGDGKLRFDFELDVKEGPDKERPIFTGPHASGPRDDRFVYLSWQRLDGRSYVNRIKARLRDIGWPLVREAQAAGKVLEADMSGRAAGGGRVPVEWRLVDA
jgi:uncharacterized protein DUF5990